MARDDVQAFTHRGTQAFVVVLGGLILAAVVLVALSVISFGSDPLGIGSDGGSGHFPNALTWATPDPWAKEGFRGYEWATAEELDRIGQDKGFVKPIRFVAADEESTGNLVVSVRPIDHVTWAAVARASNGRCYAVLVAHDRSDPQLGTTFYARFPAGTQCKAEIATPETVTLEDAPD